MYRDEIIIKLTGKIGNEFNGIDLPRIRCILEEGLYQCELTPMSTQLTLTGNMQERIKMYLACKNLDGLSKATIYEYGIQLRRFSLNIRKNVEDVTAMDIRMFLSSISEDNKLKNTTLETIICDIKSFFKWLAMEEYITKDPTLKIKATKTEGRLRNALSIEELEMLRDSCETPRQQAILEFLFSTGIRLAECEAVNISDLNFGNRSLRVIGKGNKERIVFFSEKSKLYLQKWLLARPISNNDALFISSKGSHDRLGHRSIQKEIKNIAELAKFKKSVYPHLLRHTFATLALKSGMQLSTIQKLLGHTDMSTTLVYAETSMQSIQAEHEKYMMI